MAKTKTINKFSKIRYCKACDKRVMSFSRNFGTYKCHNCDKLIDLKDTYKKIIGKIEYTPLPQISN